jgi:hypothetical protein
MDVSQAVIIYFFFLCSVCLYCWLGNELTAQVRITGALKGSLQFSIFGVIFDVKYSCFKNLI